MCKPVVFAPCLDMHHNAALEASRTATVLDLLVRRAKPTSPILTAPAPAGLAGRAKLQLQPLALHTTCTLRICVDGSEAVLCVCKALRSSALDWHVSSNDCRAFDLSTFRPFCYRRKGRQSLGGSL